MIVCEVPEMAVLLRPCRIQSWIMRAAHANGDDNAGPPRVRANRPEQHWFGPDCGAVGSGGARVVSSYDQCARTLEGLSRVVRARQGQGDPFCNVQPRTQGPRVLSRGDRVRGDGRSRQAHSRLPREITGTEWRLALRAG